MGNVSQHVIRPLAKLYGDFATDDADLVLDLYEKVLHGFTDKELIEGFAAVAGDFLPSKMRPWPPPALIARACTKSRERNPEKARQQHQDVPAEVKNKPFAIQLMGTEMARRAAHNGWVLGLWQFALRHGRGPDRGEIESMIEAARYVERAAAGKVEMGVAHEQLKQLAISMLARRERLAKHVLGE